MGLIDDLLLDGLSGGLGPSTGRGFLLLSTLLGTGLTAASAWCLASGIDPLHGPEWAFGVLAVSLIGPAVAVIFSLAVAAREPEARGLAALGIVANLAAALTVIAAVAVRS